MKAGTAPAVEPGAKAAGARVRAGNGWLRGLGCGLVLALTPATAILLMVLLSPTLLMRALDREHALGASRAVLLSNVAGSAGGLVALWKDGVPDVGTAIALLEQPATIATAWAAAAAGWLASECLSQLAIVWLAASARREARAIDAAVEVLRDEWGDPAP